MGVSSDLTDDATIRKLLEESETIAVIGMKPSGAAVAIPQYMERAGYEITPVNPKYSEVGGDASVDSVDAIEGRVDIVDIFRRGPAVSEHVDQILALDPAPKIVWFQLGIRNGGAAERLAAAGIPVVQDACLQVEHRRLLG